MSSSPQPLLHNETEDIDECLRFKRYLVRKYETTDRLQYHCAANIMGGLIDHKIQLLKKLCYQKRYSKKAVRQSAASTNIGRLSKSFANISTIFGAADDDAVEANEECLKLRDPGYPKRLVRQEAKTFTLAATETTVMDIPSACFAEANDRFVAKDIRVNLESARIVDKIGKSVLMANVLL